MDFSLYETLSVSLDDDGVATLLLDRPGQLNAFDLTMARELERFFLTDADKAAMAAVPGVAAINQNRPDLGLSAWLSRNGHDDLAAQLAAGTLTPRAAYEAARQRPPASWPF